MKNASAYSTASRQRGVGLVELMISIAIGLVLVALVTSYYLSSRQSYQTTVVSSELTDAQRYAMQQIRRQLMLAGYSDSWTPQGLTFPAAIDSDNQVPEFEDGEIIKSNSSSSLWLRQQGAELAGQLSSTCSTEQLPIAGKNETAKIALVKLYLESSGEIKCSTYIKGKSTDTIPLINGVDSLTFYYFDADGELNTYEQVDDWKSVQAVEVELLIRSETKTYDSPVVQSYIFLDGKSLDFDDRFMRTQLTRVIRLRNLRESGT